MRKRVDNIKQSQTCGVGLQNLLINSGGTGVEGGNQTRDNDNGKGSLVLWGRWWYAVILDNARNLNTIINILTKSIIK